MLAPKLDRDLNASVWSKDGTGLYVQYDDEGDTRLAFVPLTGDIRNLANKLGGLSIDRPYGGAEFTVAADGRFAFTLAGPDHPADLATGKAGAPIVRVTNLNEDIWATRKAATVEEIWYKSKLRSAAHSGLDHQARRFRSAQEVSARARDSRRARSPITARAFRRTISSTRRTGSSSCRRIRAAARATARNSGISFITITRIMTTTTS